MSKLTPAEYKLLDKMNKRLRSWAKNNMSNEVINQVKNDLLNFYTKYDRVSPNRNILLFTKSNTLSDDEKAEMLRIAKAMDSAKSSKISYYKKMPTDDKRLQKAFQTVKNNPLYNVKTFADYVQWVDDLNNAKSIVAELMELDSAMVARVYGYGTEKNLTTEQVNEILINAVNNYKDGDSMEQFLQTEIEKRELKNHININLRDRLYNYGNKYGVNSTEIDNIIDMSIQENIGIDNIEDYLYNEIDGKRQDGTFYTD